MNATLSLLSVLPEPITGDWAQFVHYELICTLKNVLVYFPLFWFFRFCAFIGGYPPVLVDCGVGFITCFFSAITANINKLYQRTNLILQDYSYMSRFENFITFSDMLFHFKANRFAFFSQLYWFMINLH